MDSPSSDTALNQILQILKHPFLTMGDFSISAFSMFYFVILFTALYYVSSRVRQFTIRRLSRHKRYNPNIEPVATIAHYLILAIGLMVILQSTGIDMSSFAFLAGAIGVGLGFGLQGITNNLLSGLIILFEQPIKVGDRVEVKEITGQVVRIGMRASTVLTNDNISIIIPNSDFIASKVINWSHTDQVIRLRIPITVTANSDPHQVIEILQNMLETLPGVDTSQVQDVVLDSFGDRSIKFYMRVWTHEYLKRPGMIRHRINLAAWDALKKNNIELSYTQMSIRVVEPSGALSLPSQSNADRSISED